MLSLLERLEEPFAKRFKKEVNMNEITAFSLQLSSKTALVMTNVFVYTFKKKFIGLDFKKVSLKDISDVYYNGSIVLEIKSGQKIILAVQNNKKKLAEKAVKRIQLKLT